MKRFHHDKVDCRINFLVSVQPLVLWYDATNHQNHFVDNFIPTDNMFLKGIFTVMNLSVSALKYGVYMKTERSETFTLRLHPLCSYATTSTSLLSYFRGTHS